MLTGKEADAAAAAIPAKERVIVALDGSEADSLRLAEALAGHAGFVKVGMTLFYEAGPAVVRRLGAMGFKVFVDLKLHDIPHQVEGAARALAMLGCDLLTVHASGGPAMMRAAVRGACYAHADGGCGPERRPAVIGVTVLTSLADDDLAAIGVTRPAREQVAALTRLAGSAGLDGVVCSPQEAALAREALGPSALVVTPGVRPAGAEAGDQRRVATPAAAIGAGASHIVVGRPVTQAHDPVAAFERIKEEVERAAG